jgi:hypothetical protein
MPDERDEPAAVAAEIRRVRETARDASEARTATLPPARPTATAMEVEPILAPAAKTMPARPRVDEVQQLASLREASSPPARGKLYRFLRRILSPLVETQVAFNARQARLNDALLDYVDARADATHRHYDAVLGQYGQHIADADQRHRMLQSELIAHVHDLVDRIDLVLAESERGRMSLEAALRDLRARLLRLEERAGGSRPQ